MLPFVYCSLFLFWREAPFDCSVAPNLQSGFTRRASCRTSTTLLHYAFAIRTNHCYHDNPSQLRWSILVLFCAKTNYKKVNQSSKVIIFPKHLRSNRLSAQRYVTGGKFSSSSTQAKQASMLKRSVM